MKINNNKFILLLILVLAVFLRFYNLMHDAPYFFNPDERNMANAITQLSLPNNTIQIFRCLQSDFLPFLKEQITDLQAGEAGNSKQKICNLNPNFFAYGQFPLYLAFVSDQLTKPIINRIDSIFNLQPIPPQRDPASGGALTTNFPSAIFWLRFYSALSSVGTVWLVYLITKGWKLGLSASILTTFSAGLIQSAHFGTTESLLTFFFVASLYLSLQLYQNSFLLHIKKYLIQNAKYLILLSLTIGIATGSKLTGLFFLIPPFIALIIQLLQIKLQSKVKKVNLIIPLLNCFIVSLLIIVGSTFFAVISSPYNLIKPEDFRSAVFGYEADVATGKYEAFYTRQFAGSTPILFQMEKIFPYALGLPVFILGIIGFLLIICRIIYDVFLYIFNRIKNVEIRMKNNKIQIKIKKLKIKQIISIHYSYFIILTSSFLIYLLPNAFLFAKWSRFMTPILPLFTIFAAYLLHQIYNLTNTIFPKSAKGKHNQLELLTTLISFALCASAIVPGIAFMSIYIHPDSRLQASYWIYDHIPQNSYILSETANVVDIPLGLPDDLNEHTKAYTVISFDFYHMDENPLIFTDLISQLEKADYIFIPSRRIFANYTQHADKFPLVTKYYQLLYSGALGFEKIAEISSFPSLSYLFFNPQPTTYNPQPFLSFPDEAAEETFTVFDHPVIRVYKKVKYISAAEYKDFFLH